MGQFGLAVGVLEAQFHAVGLESLEVGDGGDLEPFLLRGAPHFEVEGHGGGEADVAATEFKDVVGETQLVEQSAHVFLHVFEGVVAAVGVLDDDDLHFAELVQAVQAADVLAVASRLATEALGVAYVADGELVGTDDDVAVEVGDGHLGGGYHIEAVEWDGVHLSLLVGQLAGAEARGFVDH